MRRKLLLTAVLVAGAVGGCRHKCCSPTSTPRPYLPLPPSAGMIPPPGVPVTPAPVGGQLPPADLGAFPGGSVAPAPATKGPAPEILLPDPVPGGKSSLSSPGLLEPPTRAPQVTQEPPLAAGATGVPGFVRVNATAASGRRPALDGFDTLKKQGFRSVVYLHPPGADVAAVRDVAEKKGLTFTAIEPTPETLTDAAAAFDRVLMDRSAQPVYVFDDDGLRAGALWYVRFRTADQLSPDVARIRARGLGLTDDTDEARAYWVVIQQHFGR
jgi:protein tyrosine phosphatase (PTP) superfamily phosphohydrolase (DUF442 family)